MTVIMLEKFLKSDECMDYLWTVKDVRRACGVPTKGRDCDILGVSIDSRKVQKGDLFIALKNEKDGHDYVQKAYEMGAVCAVVDHVVEGCAIEQIVVEDTFKALWKMADAQRSWATNVKRVAVTGSCGKTSVKDLLAAALGCHKSVESYNNHWGVPLTLCRMPRDERFAVFEVGMNRPGEIAPLSELVKPDVAIITTVAPAHIGAFDSVDDIMVEKSAVMEGLTDKKNLILPHSLYLKYKHFFDVKPYTFSLDEFGQADTYVEAVKENVTGQQVVACILGETVNFNLYLHGRHQVENALAVLTAVKLVGGDLAQAVNNIGVQKPAEGRGRVHEVGGVIVVDESYNANPASMKAALSVLKNRLGIGRRVAILGEMAELGADSKTYHLELIPQLEGVDTVITVGDEMKVVFDGLPKGVQKVHYPSQKEVNLQKIARQLDAGDVVMVKGSNSVFWKWGFVKRLVLEVGRLSQTHKVNNI